MTRFDGLFVGFTNKNGLAGLGLPGMWYFLGIYIFLYLGSTPILVVSGILDGGVDLIYIHVLDMVYT